MQQIKRKFPIAVLLTLLLAISINNITFGQSSLPDRNISGNGQFFNASQDVATTKGEGIWIVLILALSYGVFRRIRTKENKPDEADKTELNPVE